MDTVELRENNPAFGGNGREKQQKPGQKKQYEAGMGSQSGRTNCYRVSFFIPILHTINEPIENQKYVFCILGIPAFSRMLISLSLSRRDHASAITPGNEALFLQTDTTN